MDLMEIPVEMRSDNFIRERPKTSYTSKNFSFGIKPPPLLEEPAKFYRSGEEQTTILKSEIRKLVTNTKSWTQIFTDAHRFKNQ